MLSFATATIVAVVVVCAGINIWMVADSSRHIETLGEYDASADAPADCIVVFGASIYADGSLSPILENRVDAGIELYERGAAPVIIMSGDGRDPFYDEPAAMKAYAVSQGVPPEAVYCDPGGYHTYETLWRASNVYGARSIIAVTQRYHLSRCVFDARGVGMDAVGVVSDSGVYDEQLWYDFRESVSRVVDFFTVAFSLPPESQGEPITL